MTDVYKHMFLKTLNVFWYLVKRWALVVAGEPIYILLSFLCSDPVLERGGEGDRCQIHQHETTSKWKKRGSPGSLLGKLKLATTTLKVHLQY